MVESHSKGGGGGGGGACPQSRNGAKFLFLHQKYLQWSQRVIFLLMLVDANCDDSVTIPCYVHLVDLKVSVAL